LCGHGFFIGAAAMQLTSAGKLASIHYTDHMFRYTERTARLNRFDGSVCVRNVGVPKRDGRGSLDAATLRTAAEVVTATARPMRLGSDTSTEV